MQPKKKGKETEVSQNWPKFDFRYKVHLHSNNIKSEVASYTNQKEFPLPDFWYLDSKGIKEKEKQGGYILGLKTNSTPQKNRNGNETRGFLRVLKSGIENRELPLKHYEYFLPYPEGMEHALPFRITSEALNRFQQLAQSRKKENEKVLKEIASLEKEIESLEKEIALLENHDRIKENNDRIKRNNDRKEEKQNQLLPYHLKGDTPFADRNYSLRAGDIVFFRPGIDSNTGDVVIDEVWVSQIWRKEIKPTTHDFFSQIDPELLPFIKDDVSQEDKKRKRKYISPAEALFGFVEETQTSSKENAQGHAQTNNTPGGKALAGRVRFHTGYLSQYPTESTRSPYLDTCTLKILATPKPPCPPLYFKKKELNEQSTIYDCHISKQELGETPNDFHPQGRKFYVNHHVSQNASPAQVDEAIIKRASAQNVEKPHLHCAVTPLKTECVFEFHIDFDNLTDWELGLLLYSLEPSPGYLHKMGFAKPLGFGSVDISVESLQLVDRQNCYRVADVDELQKPRYSDGADCIEGLRKLFIRTMDEDVKKSLDVLGQTLGNAGTQVQYPISEKGKKENEHFEWFKKNNEMKKKKKKKNNSIKKDESPCGLLPLNFAQYHEEKTETSTENGKNDLSEKKLNALIDSLKLPSF